MQKQGKSEGISFTGGSRKEEYRNYLFSWIWENITVLPSKAVDIYLIGQAWNKIKFTLNALSM